MSNKPFTGPPRLIGRWHTTKDGQLHDGHSSECKICKRNKNKPPPKKPGRRRVYTDPPRRCKCGSPIERNNKTGLCQVCYNDLRRQQKEERQAQGPKCQHCGRLLSKKPKTGLCIDCYMKSKEAAKQREKQQDYNTAALFGKKVRPKGGNNG